MATNNSKYIIYNPVVLPDTTQSTSLTTGAEVITGGEAIGGNLYVGGNINDATLTASQSVATDSSKNLISIPHTGTGNNVLSNSPTLVTPVLGAATGTSIQLSGLTASQAVATDSSKNLVSVETTGTGNYVLSASPTFTGTIIASASTYSGVLTANATIAMANTKITGLATPTATTDAVTKSYVDGGNPQTTTGAQTTTADVTGLVFTSGHFEINIEVHIVATSTVSELFKLNGILSGNGNWNMSSTSLAGEDTTMSFVINSSGQVRYTSGTYAGFSSLTFIWKKV